MREMALQIKLQKQEEGYLSFISSFSASNRDKALKSDLAHNLSKYSPTVTSFYYENKFLRLH